MGPKQKKSVSPSDFGGFFVTPKLPWCFFTSYRSSMYWCHCGGLPLPLASPRYLWCFHHFRPEGVCWDCRRFWWTLARVWCNPNKPMIVLLGGELLDIFDLFIPKLGELSDVTCADVSTRLAVVFRWVIGNWLSPILIFWRWILKKGTFGNRFPQRFFLYLISSQELNPG